MMASLVLGLGVLTLSMVMLIVLAVMAVADSVHDIRRAREESTRIAEQAPSGPESWIDDDIIDWAGLPSTGRQGRDG